MIESVDFPKGQYVSNIFLRPKPNNKYRMIIGLSDLNNDIEKHHFKMQHLEVAIDMLDRGSFLVSIDLKDAYYTVPIDPLFRKFLCFQWRVEFFRFMAMPFGLTSAPQLFTKLLALLSVPSERRASGDFPMWTIRLLQGIRRRNAPGLCPG